MLYSNQTKLGHQHIPKWPKNGNIDNNDPNLAIQGYPKGSNNTRNINTKFINKKCGVLMNNGDKSVKKDQF